jgi:DNA polymerase III subunit beta
MKFRCERDILVEALSTASRAVASRSGGLLVLSGIRLEVAGDQLRLAGSDLDLSIQVAVPVAGEGDGVAVLPARLTTDIVRALEPGAVTLEVADDEASIASGRSQFTVRTLPAEEFPRLPEPAAEAVTLAATDFADALRQVVPAASRDDARPILTGVLMAAEEGGLRLVATDSYRLAVRDLPGTSVLREGQKVLVPSRALGELSRLLAGADDVTLRLGEREATFEVGPARLTTRLIEGDFPNYRQLIPSSYPNRMVVAREALLDAVRRVKLLAREAAPVRMTMRPDGLALTAITQDVGQAHEDLDAKFEGTELVVAFNPEFLITGVEAIGGEEVAIETLDTLKPAVVRSTEGSDYLYLLMPVRVS